MDETTKKKILIYKKIKNCLHACNEDIIEMMHRDQLEHEYLQQFVGVEKPSSIN